MPNINLAETVHEFMRIGGQTVDTPDARQASLYLGLQMEELAEKLDALISVSPFEQTMLAPLSRTLKITAQRAKEGAYMPTFSTMFRETIAAHEQCVDADADLAWVALGSLMCSARMPFAIIHEVARANMDKYPNGVAMRDSNGKIQKPTGWRGPDHLNFL